MKTTNYTLHTNAPEMSDAWNPELDEQAQIEALVEAGFWAYSTDEFEDSQFALAIYLGCDPSDLEEERHKCYDALTTYSIGNQEYAIGTDSEADEAWEASLESYLEECIYPELPESMKGYFDDEAWKRDARHDGRGHSLSSYDGCENEGQFNGEWFYIYRLN